MIVVCKGEHCIHPRWKFISTTLLADPVQVGLGSCEPKCRLSVTFRDKARGFIRNKRNMCGVTFWMSPSSGRNQALKRMPAWGHFEPLPPSFLSVSCVGRIYQEVLHNVFLEESKTSHFLSQVLSATHQAIGTPQSI